MFQQVPYLSTDPLFLRLALGGSERFVCGPSGVLGERRVVVVDVHLVRDIRKPPNKLLEIVSTIVVREVPLVDPERLLYRNALLRVGNEGSGGRHGAVVFLRVQREVNVSPGAAPRDELKLLGLVQDVINARRGIERRGPGVVAVIMERIRDDKFEIFSILPQPLSIVIFNCRIAVSYTPRGHRTHSPTGVNEHCPWYVMLGEKLGSLIM